MAWEVEFTDEFEEWWHSLSESEQGKVDARVGLLIEHGPNLGFPFSSQVKTSRFPEMRELRVQAAGDPLRYCSSPVTKPETADGMRRTLRWRIGCLNAT